LARKAMDRRKFLLGLLTGLAAAPAIVAAASRGEAAPLPDAGPPATVTDTDVRTVESEWAQVGARRLRRIERRAARRDRRVLRRVARRDRRVLRRERRIIRRMRRRGAIY
jgi:hypothetical protein